MCRASRARWHLYVYCYFLQKRTSKTTLSTVRLWAIVMGDDTDYTHDISRYCNLTIVRVSGDDTFRNPSTINIAVVSSRYDKIKVGLKLCQSAAWPDQ